MLEAQVSSATRNATRHNNAYSSENESEDEEDRYQRELESALKQSQADRNDPSKSHASASSRANTTNRFILDRAILERERLERQRNVKRARGENPDEDRLNKRSRSGEPSTSASSSVELSTANGVSIPMLERFFWNSELFPVANKHSQPRLDNKPTIRLSEILGKVSTHSSLHGQSNTSRSAEIRYPLCNTFFVFYRSSMDISILRPEHSCDIGWTTGIWRSAYKKYISKLGSHECIFKKRIRLHAYEGMSSRAVLC